MTLLDTIYDPSFRQQDLDTQSTVAVNYFLKNARASFYARSKPNQEQVMDSFLRDEIPGYAGRQDVGAFTSFKNALYKGLVTETGAAFAGLAGIASQGAEDAAARLRREAEIKYPSRGASNVLGRIVGEILPTAGAIVGTTLLGAEPGSTVAGTAILASKAKRLTTLVRQGVFAFQGLKAGGLREAEITQQEIETGEDISGVRRHTSALGRAGLVYAVEFIGLEQIGKRVPAAVNALDDKALAALGTLITTGKGGRKEAAKIGKALLAGIGVTATVEGIEEGLEQFGGNVIDIATRTAQEGTTPFTGIPQAIGLGAIGGGLLGPLAVGSISVESLRGQAPGGFTIHPREPKGDPFALREGMFVAATDPSTNKIDTARVDKVMSEGASVRVTFTTGEKATLRTSDTSADYIGLSDERLVDEVGPGAVAEKFRRGELIHMAQTPGSALNTLIEQGKKAFPEHQDETLEAVTFIVSMVARNEGLSPNEIAERISIEQGGEGEAPVLRLYQQGSQPWYYSKLEKVVNELQIGKRIPSAELKNLLLKRGVKAQEMRATGLQDMMDENEFIGRDDLIRHVQENLVRVESVRDDSDAEKAIISRNREIVDRVTSILSDRPLPGVSIDNIFLSSNNQLIAAGADAETMSLTHEHQLNLGDREGIRHINLTLPGGEDYTEVRLVTPDVTLEGEPGFEGIEAHFPENNIAGWFRSKTRFTEDGKKVLYLEEIQEDWYAAERRVGIKGEKGRAELATNLARQEELGLTISGPELTAEIERGAIVEMQRLEREATVLRTDIESAPILPNPFGDKWYEPVMKYAIRFATENGYDAISFTSPAVQKNRWGVSGDRIKKIEYRLLGDSEYSIITRGSDSTILHHGVFSKGALLEFLPGSIVDQIVSGHGTTAVPGIDAFTTFDTDIQVGGSGEKFDILYGQQIPKFIAKFAKRHKTEVGEFRVSRDDLSSLKDVKGETVSLDDTKAPLLNLNKSIRQESLDGAELFQQDPETGEAKGSAEILNSGRVIVRALKSPDVSTMVEEMFHAYQLLFPKTFNPVAKWSGAQEVKGEWDWTVNNNAPSEKLAKAWLKYLANGSTPNPRFRPIFEKMRAWFKTIWNRLSNIVGSTGGKKQRFSVNADVQAFFDRLVAGTAPATGPPFNVGAVQAASPVRFSPSEDRELGKLADDSQVAEPGMMKQLVMRGSTVLKKVSPRFVRDLTDIDKESHINRGSEAAIIHDALIKLKKGEDEDAVWFADGQATPEEIAKLSPDQIALANAMISVYDNELLTAQTAERLENEPYGLKPGDDGYVGLRLISGNRRVPITKGGHPIPQLANKEGVAFLNEAIKDGQLTPRVAAEIKRLVDEGKAEDDVDALAMIRKYAESQLRGVFPYFERERTYQLPKKYRELHASVIAERTLLTNNIFLSALKRWGIKFDGRGINQFNLVREVERVKQEVGPTIGNKMEDFIAHIFHGEGARDIQSAKVMQNLSNFETASKLAGVLGPLRNSMQPFVSGIARYGPVQVAKANIVLFPLVHHLPFKNRWTEASRKARREILASGAVSARTALTAVETPHRTLVEWIISPFVIAEIRNQYVAALVATYGIQRDVNKLMKMGVLEDKAPVLGFFSKLGLETIERRMEKVELSDDDILQLRDKLNSGENLTVDDVKGAAFLYNRDTNFPLTLTTERLWWRKNTGLRLLTKFKMFGVEQTGVIYRDVISEARKGNPLPAFWFLMGGVIVGELYNLARDLIYDKEESLTVGVLMAQSTENRRIGTRIMNNLLDGGVVGIFADIVYGSGNFLLGPIGSTSVNALDTLVELGYTPGPARAGILMDAARSEVPAIRQIEGMIRFSLKGIGKGPEGNYVAYKKARNLSAEIDEDVEDDLMDDIGQFAARALAPAHTKFPFTERTYLIRRAAEAISYGEDKDIARAASMITEMYTNADPKDRKDVRQGILSALKRRSPLGAVKKRNMREFRGRLTDLEFNQIREVDRLYLRSVREAYRRGIREGNRIFDQREQSR